MNPRPQIPPSGHSLDPESALPVVSAAHAVVQPFAVVVKARDTFVAGAAMFGFLAPGREIGRNRLLAPNAPRELNVYHEMEGGASIRRQ